MSIGKKIALGFGLLIALTATLGGIAVFNMKSVERAAAELSQQFVPESEIAANLAIEVGHSRLATRAYGLTGDAATLEDARGQIAEIKSFIEAAQKLSRQYPSLVNLREGLDQLEPALKTYEQALDETEVQHIALAKNRLQMDDNALKFTKDIDDLLARHRESLAEEIKASSQANKLDQSVRKVALATDIRALCHLGRIAIFKAQALRDVKLVDEARRNFDDLDSKFEELTPLVRVPSEIIELDVCKKTSALYKVAVIEMQTHYKALSEISRKRSEAGEKISALSHEISRTGLNGAMAAANESRVKLARAASILTVGLGLAFICSIVIAFLIIRGTTRILSSVAGSLDEGSSEVAAAAAQVSASSQTLAEGASEQAAALEETSASLEEMASMTKRNAENAETAKILANQTRIAADSGANEMKEMTSAMDAIKISSDNIAKIIKTIDEIAFQTNILALNAAVEAARAGEAGMGFAVVADEVRNLAQRSAKAARETAERIEDSIRKSERGVQISGHVAQSLAEIVEKARQMDEIVGEIATASREQSHGIQQVNTAVTQMDKVTQSNAGSAEESASASEELNAQAGTLKEAIAELLQIVGGSARSVSNRGSAKAFLRKPGTVSPPRADLNWGGNHRKSSGVKTIVQSRAFADELPMDDDFKDF